MTGEFVWGLAFTDILNQWTENLAVWNKSAVKVVDRVRQVEQKLLCAFLERVDGGGSVERKYSILNTRRV